MTDRERKLGAPGVMRHNLGMPLVKLHQPSPTGKADVIRWLRLIEEDPWYELCPVPIGADAFLALLGHPRYFKGVRTARVGVAAYGGGTTVKRYSVISSELAAQLAALMEEIAAGKLVFYRPPGHRPKQFHQAHRLRTPSLAGWRYPTLFSRSDYDWWSNCRACGGRRYAPVTIAGQEYVACFDCIPPSTYRIVGALPSARSLIPEAIEKWGTSSEPSPASTRIAP